MRSDLVAALGVEFRLLRAERSLVVVMPAAIFISTLELAFYEVVPDVSYSATYASGTAQALLLFLFGITVFYTGEAMHRDREMKVEPLLWSAPAPNYVLLLSKFLAPVALSLTLITLVALTAIVLQISKGHLPIEITGYLIIYSVILIPSLVFIAGTTVLLNVLLQNKYLTYVVIIATGGGLFYLYNQGYNHWSYNPLLYQLWTYADLTKAGDAQTRILTHRMYCLAIAVACLSLAHLCCQRKSNKGLRTDGRLSSAGWAILTASIAVALAVLAIYILIGGRFS